MADGVIRVNISVPKDLKSRMEQIGDGVNWSAVATEAFRRKVLEMESKPTTDDTNALAARYDAAEEMEGQEQYQEGRRAGEQWVREGNAQTVLRAMRRLEKVDENPAEDVEYMLGVYGNGMNQGTAVGLAGMMGCTDEGEGRQSHWHKVKAFWAEILDNKDGAEQIEEYQFALGFVHGAMELWQKIQQARARKK